MIVVSLGVSEPAAAAPEGWVPVERRWLGLDRRTVWPAALVLAVAVWMIFVVPAIDRAVPVGRPVQPGEVLALRGGVQFTPAAGWTVTNGVAVGDPDRSGEYPTTAAVTSRAVSFSVTTGNYTGSPMDLLTSIELASERVTAGRGPQAIGYPRTTRTASGLEGVVTEVGDATSVGSIAAFVVEGTGVEVVVDGPRVVGTVPAEDVAEMLSSIARQGGN